MNRLLFFALILSSITACKSDDAPSLVQYEIQAYETGEENLFVLDTINGIERVSVSSTFIDFGIAYKKNQFPEYLEESVFRSFAFVNDSTVQVTIKTRNTENIEKKNYTLSPEGTLDGLPDFFYFSQDDYFVQCFGLVKTKAGPVQSIGNIYTTSPILCGDRDGEAIANERKGQVSHSDTLLVTYVYLPFKKV